MSFKVKALIGVAVVLVLAIGGLLYLGSHLDSLVKDAIERYGSEMTGTQVSVSSVELFLKEGRGTLRGLAIANPEGFSGGDAVRFGEITLAFDLNSLSGGNPIVIDQAIIRDPYVAYERNQAGQGNLETLQANIDRFRGTGSGGSTAESGTSEAKRFRIKQFVFEDGKIHISAPELQQPVDATLPSIHLNDVGGAQGATPEQIGKIVLSDFANSAGKTVAQQGLERILDKQLGDGAGEKARGLIKSILK